MVADAVRKPAARSREAAEDVRDVVGNTRTSTAGAVGAINGMRREVDEGSRETGDAQQVFAEISTAMDEVSLSIPSIGEMIDVTRNVGEEEVAATEEMTAMAGEVTSAVRDVADIAQRTTELAQGVTANTEEVTATVQRLALYGETLTEVAGELSSLTADDNENTETEDPTLMEAANG